MEVGKMYIDGQWVLADSGATRDIFNPATGELVATVAEGGLDETRRAVDSAYAAQESWGATNHFQRAALLEKSAALIQAKTEEIARLESLHTGKLLKTTMGDVASVAMILRYYAGIIGTPAGESYNSMQQLTTISMLEPIGVCGLIVPWNSPVSIGIKCIAPALAAGNTIVVKPASITPLGMIKLFECFEEAGFPKGVINLVLGAGEVIGNELGENVKVGKVTLTGGTDTGKSLVRASASNVKRLSLELGGKSPALVFADGDVDYAVNQVMYGLFNNAGQVCIASSRVYVQKPVYEKFVETLVEKTKKIRLGVYDDPDAEMCTLISQTQMDKVLGFIESGKADGATLACGGYRVTEGEFGKGYFVAPTVFTNCRQDMSIVREEIFGPVMVVLPFETEEEAFALANDSIYGLGAAIFTADQNRSWRFTKKVKAACLWVNSYYGAAGLDCAIYCCKQSGYSTLMGTACLKSYMDIKQVTFNHAPQMNGYFKG